MQNKKIILLFFSLLILTSLICVTNVKAQSSIVVVFKSNGNGAIGWTDLTQPYHDGITSSNYTIAFSGNDEIYVYSVPASGYIFSSYYYQSASSSGYIYNSTFTTTPLEEYFNVTVTFVTTSTPSVKITADEHAGIAYTDLTQPFHDGTVTSGNTATVQFGVNDIVTFQAIDIATDWAFSYWAIEGSVSGSNNNNPVNITVTDNFNITSNTFLATGFSKIITFNGAGADGSIMWIDETTPFHDGATFGTQIVTFPLNDYVTVYATGTGSNTFKSFTVNDVEYPTYPFYLQVTDNLEITANFNTIAPYTEPAIYGQIMGIAVLFAVLFIPAGVGYYFLGEYGALAGLNIGAIGGYLVIPVTVPVLVPVIIIVIDVLILFGGKRLHGD